MESGGVVSKADGRLSQEMRNIITQASSESQKTNEAKRERQMVVGRASVLMRD